MHVIVTDGLIIYGHLGHKPSRPTLYCQVGQNHLSCWPQSATNSDTNFHISCMPAWRRDDIYHL